jgi:hypothetical protein
LMAQKGVYAALFEKQTQGGESIEESTHWPWKPVLPSSIRSWAAKFKGFCPGWVRSFLEQQAALVLRKM